MEHSTTSLRSSLNAIPAEDLQLVWGVILPGLKKVQERNRSHWIVEDVYTSIRTGHSTLHIGYVNGDYEGFMVLTPSSTWDGRVMHIWCVFSKGEHDLMDIFAPNLDVIARSYGAKRVTFWGPKAWERYGIARHGFTAMQVEYVKEL